MGLFSKILPALEGIAGVVLMATGIGVVAGAMLLTSALASSGVIGGSVGKFLNSGLGQGLMAAVSLGSTAYAMYGADALQTSMTAMDAEGSKELANVGAATTAQTSGQIVADTAASQAGTTADLVATGSINSAAAGITPAESASLATPASAAANGVPQESLQASISAGSSQQAAAEQLNATQQATNTGGGTLTASPKAPGAPAGTEAGGSYSAPEGAPQPTTPNPDDLTGVQGSANKIPVDANGNPITSDAFGKTPATSGGLLNTALNTRGGAAAIQGVGSLVGGIGQGITQKQTMQDQINAMQYATRSYGGQGGAQLAGAAAAPVTVPQGYLQRAQALRTMLNQGGVAGVQPQAGPVPVLGMGSTPRGGVI